VTAAPRGRAGAAGDSSALIVELLRELLRQQTQLNVQLRGRARSMFWRAALSLTQALLMGRRCRSPRTWRSSAPRAWARRCSRLPSC